MRAHRTFTRIAVATVIALLGVAGPAQSAQLSACASQTPPFVLTAEGKGVGGFSVDLLREVARHMKRELQVLELPWARCLNEVRNGRVDIAIDAYDDAERRTLFFYSEPYYRLTPQVFYSARGSKPMVAAAKAASDLDPFRGCGVHEYTYEHYGLNEKQMDRGALNDLQMIKMLLGGRCDYAVEELEFIIGQRRTEPGWPDEKELRSFQPAWAEGPQLHWLVGRQRADGRAMTDSLNAGLAAVSKAGVPARLRAKYLTEPARQ